MIMMILDRLLSLLVEQTLPALSHMTLKEPFKVIQGSHK